MAIRDAKKDHTNIKNTEENDLKGPTVPQDKHGVNRINKAYD